MRFPAGRSTTPPSTGTGASRGFAHQWCHRHSLPPLVRRSLTDTALCRSFWSAGCLDADFLLTSPRRRICRCLYEMVLAPPDKLIVLAKGRDEADVRRALNSVNFSTAARGHRPRDVPGFDFCGAKVLWLILICHATVLHRGVLIRWPALGSCARCTTDLAALRTSPRHSVRTAGWP